MPLRSTTHRTGIAALAAGIAAVGVLAVPASASAASDVTLRVTTSRGDSVVALVWEKGSQFYTRTCALNITVGVTKEIHVAASKGASMQIWPSHHCYDALSPIRINVDHDGQVIDLKL
jgi:hypothetical protein